MTLAVVFFFSGAGGLLYEIVAGKCFALVFGCMAESAAAVLAAYMMGLALGAVAGGWLADRVRRPVVAYAACELATALAMLALLPARDPITRLYLSLGASTAVKIALAMAVVLAPTALMGATLPVLARAVAASGGGRAGADALARLYAANTAGAAAGILVGTFALLPALGLPGTLAVAAALDVVAGGVALATGGGAPPPPEERAGEVAAGTRGGRRGAVLAGIAVASVALFGLEVVWTHVLAAVAGNSTYAFGSMLFAVLAGLALGGKVAARAGVTPAEAMVGVALGVAGTLPFWDRAPQLFDAIGPYATSFAARELVRLGVCVALVVPAAVWAGVAFPLAVARAAEDGPVGTRVGAACAVSTLGAVLGSLAAGFGLLDAMPSQQALRVLALVALGAAALYAYADPAAPRGRAVGGALACLAVLAVAPAWNMDRLTSGANVDFNDMVSGDLVFVREDKRGGITTVRAAGPVKTLYTNGKFQGNNDDEVQPQVAFALIPLLMLEQLRNALVIGLGTGTTTAVVAAHPFRAIDVAELSPGIVEASRAHFAAMTGGVLDDPRVHVKLTDGRNHLLVEERRYDLISMEVTSIWFAGASSLYTREFYRLAHARLEPGGIVQQWVQLHHMSPLDLARILATVRTEFRYVSLWVVGQGVIVASDAPFALKPELFARRNADPALARLKRVAGGDFRRLAKQLLLEPDGLDRFLDAYAARERLDRAALVVDDDHNALEYSTPRAYAFAEDTRPVLLEAMLPFRSAKGEAFAAGK